MTNLNVFNGPEDTLPLAEVFSTIQGEGRLTGRPSTFVRLSGCNLQCSWCDTPYTWRDDELAKSPPQHVTKERLTSLVARNVPASGHRTQNLVLTGGEPLLHRKKLETWLPYLLEAIPDIGSVEFETNGTAGGPLTFDLSVEQLFNLPPFFYNVSLKLPSSGNDKLVSKSALLKHIDTSWRSGDKFSENVLFKFVVTNAAEDIELIDGLVDACKIPPSAIALMPQGKTREDQLAALEHVASLAIPRGYLVSARVHTLIWGDKRGV